MSKTLTTTINFFQNPTEGQTFGFEITNNGTPITFGTGATASSSVQKIFVGLTGQSFPVGRILKMDTDLVPASPSYLGSFDNGIVRSISYDPVQQLVVAGGEYTQWNGLGYSRFLKVPDTSTGNASNYNINNTVRKTIRTSNGTLFLAGDFTSFEGITTNRLVKILPTGLIDTTFRNNMMSGTTSKGFNSVVRTIEVDSLGRILAGGAFATFNGVSRNGLARLNSNGTLDGTFNVGAGFNGPINVIKQLSNGNYLIAGEFTSYNGTSVNRVVILNNSAAIVSTWGTGFDNGAIWDAKQDSATNIHLVGSFTSFKGGSANRAIKVSVSGTNLNGYGTGFSSGTARCIDILPDGKILIGGAFSSYNGTSVSNFVKLNSDGTYDSKIDFNSDVYDIEVSGSFIYVAGSFTTYTRIVAASSSLFNIPLGGSMTSTATNTYNNILTFNSDPAFSVSINGANDLITIVYTFDDTDIVTATKYDLPGTLRIAFINQSLTLPEVIQETVVRSPYLVISEDENAFDTAEYNVRIFEGSLYSGDSLPVSYNIQKSKLFTAQEKIYVNLNNLIREDLEGNAGSFVSEDYYLSAPLPSNMSKWCQIDELLTSAGTTVDSNKYYLFSTDGYLYNDEVQKIPNVLLTGNERYISRSQKQRIYFQTNFLESITFSVDGQIPTLVSTLENPELLNTYYVQSLLIPTQEIQNASKIEYRLSYSNSDTETITFNIYDDCLYESWSLLFKNKWGVLETLPMTKKSVRKLQREGVNFKRSIVDFNGNYDITRHTDKQFNVTGKESWVLNTDWLPEYMNQAIEEVKLSEEVWLISQNSDIYPVIVKSDSTDYKTRINDKLIQYTIEVEMSHSVIKNIL